MTSADCRKELQEFLQREFQSCKVVALPDFFLDRIINLECDTAEFSGLVAEVAKRKGGSIDGIPQADLRGGNAINVASALANLGSTVTPIVCTSKFGLQQLKYHFQNRSIDLSRVKTFGKPSVTTALEFESEDGRANVMLRDVGALAGFGPQDLDERDYELVEDADYVCLFDWAGAVRFGTELAQAVFERAKRNGKTKTYYDTADPTPKLMEVPALMDKVLKTDKVDILSLNENEAIIYASQLDSDLKNKQEHLGFAELAMESARILAKHLSSRIDLHTTVFSATLKGKQEVVVPAFNVQAQRATGAGDAWCAGNIIGDHNGLSDECRLMLANAVSACYLQDAEGQHPTREELANFLAKQV